MKLTRPNLWTLAVLLVACAAIPAFGQAPTIDYLGYGWEDGALPPSNPGDVLTCVGTADNVDAIFGVDLGTEELTFHLYGLVSVGEVPLGGGIVMISYTGGMLDVWRDGAQNADYGINPPNGTAPSSFTDGTLFFSGAFNSFTLFLNPDGSGAFEGNLDGVGGEILGSMCTNCAYTWGGSFTSGSGAQVPDGYDIQMDGELQIEDSVANEDATWSQLKTLFR